MARQKRSSQVLEKAEGRFRGLKAINENLDLGNGLSLEVYQQQMAEVDTKLEAYNNLLIAVDAALNDLEASEKALTEFNTRMLNAIAALYGKDSNEYEMAGGTRTSERKRPTTSKPPTTDPQ